METLPAPLLLIQTDLDSPRVQPFAGGHTVVYTARAPDKTSMNEDCLALIPYAETSGIMVIADGMGGTPEGHTASKSVIQILSKHIQRAAQEAYPLRDAILDAIERSNAAILEHGRGSGTTLALVEWQNGAVRPYHIGDTSILLTGLRGKIKLQSIAHSPVGYAVESGLLDRDEAVHHEERHLISNMLGADDMHITVGSVMKVAPYDTLLLASDGLTDNLYQNEISEIIRSGDLLASAQQLQQLAVSRMSKTQTDLPSHSDDLSFILFRPARQKRNT